MTVELLETDENSEVLKARKEVSLLLVKISRLKMRDCNPEREGKLNQLRSELVVKRLELEKLKEGL